MSEMRRRSSRQSGVPPDERSSQRRRRATSLNYELPHNETMETIDQLVQVCLPEVLQVLKANSQSKKEYLVFPNSEDSSRVVSASVIEAEFLHRIGHKSLKDAWTMVAR
ncbi:hypothetical protein R1flu_027587 [Riccia fluitans]|uniref:Uncharacterized protein n=1 Tax=Riccia fluitans TaxID=41844 RepID=A0ABD1XJR9_9MARC